MICSNCRKEIHPDEPRSYFGQFIRHRGDRCAQLLMMDVVELTGKLAQAKACQWKPIEVMHEDHGQCVVINLIEDDCYLEVASIIDTDFDKARWTHFARIPEMTTEDAERMLAAMESK